MRSGAEHVARDSGQARVETKIKFLSLRFQYEIFFGFFRKIQNESEVMSMPTTGTACNACNCHVASVAINDSPENVFVVISFLKIELKYSYYCHKLCNAELLEAGVCLATL
jgi:hypothetical protein